MFVSPHAPPRWPPHLLTAAPLPPVQTQLRKKEDEAALVAPYSATFNRTMISTILDSESGGLSTVGRTIRVGGWVKTGREAGAGAFAFLEVNDGSCFANLQVLVDKEVAAEVGSLKELVPTATCVLVEGELKKTPEGTRQKVRRECCGVRASGSIHPLPQVWTVSCAEWFDVGAALGVGLGQSLAGG